MRRLGFLTQRQWFALHSWLGLKFALLLSVILISGTVATLGHEIHWLVNPHLRVTPQESRVSWQEMVASVERAYPDRTLAKIGPQPGGRFAVQAMMYTPDRAIRYVYVDPYTGEVTGDTRGYNAHLFLRHLHRFLFLGPTGIYIVGFFSFFLIASLVSGLLVYRKFWRGFFRLPPLRPARAFWGGMHKVAGLWSLWFVLLMGVTGGWYFAEQLLTDTGNRVSLPRPLLTDAMLDELKGSPTTRIGVEEAVHAAQRELPGLRVETISFPANAHDPIRVSGHTDALLVHDRASAVYVHPFDGSVLDSHRAEELSLGMRLIESANPLHFGDFGGLASKLVWLAFGILLSGLAISGALVWVKRTHHRLAEDGGRPRMMGRWKYLNLLFLAPLPVLGYLFVGFTDPVRAAGPTLPAQELGGGAASLTQVREARPGGSASFFVDLSPDLAQRARAVHVNVGDEPGEGSEVDDFLRKPRVKAPVPNEAGPGTSVWLTVELLDGRRESIGWPLELAASPQG